MVKIAKTKIMFVCQGCGWSSPKWVGRCPECGNWNSLVEEETVLRPASAQRVIFEDPVLLSQVEAGAEERTSIGISELDRVFGGGVVRGSVTLIGGDPGVGKSTMSLQISHRLAAQGAKVLYVSGEESVKQTKLRADRLGAAPDDKLYIASLTDMDTIIACIKKLLPDFVVVDSIQVVYTQTLSSSAGSVGQIRQCAACLAQVSKQSGIAMFLIGHVTKEGALAGPKVLEHIVDTVLYFEGERFSSYRVLRAFKNRFGSTNEIGVFEMGTTGLEEVKNPSAIFLSERPKGVPGSVVVPVVEGTRPILVELQALVAHATFGVTRRKAQGLDYNRLTLLVAVLEKRLSLKLFDRDVFVNAVGGIKIEDPAADLGTCLAIGSSFYDKAIPSDIVALGEVGLAAELRSVANIQLRVRESHKLGFKKCILPKTNHEACKSLELGGMQLIPAQDLGDVFRYLWPS